jgi:hypothetical protein
MLYYPIESYEEARNVIEDMKDILERTGEQSRSERLLSNQSRDVIEIIFSLVFRVMNWSLIGDMRKTRLIELINEELGKRSVARLCLEVGNNVACFSQ